MNVLELQELLSTFHPDDEVVVCMDTQFSRYATVSDYQCEHSGQKPLYSRPVAPASNDRKISLERVDPDCRPCVILFS